MNNIFINSTDNSFSIHLYDFEYDISSDYFQFKFELITPIFKVSLVSNASADECIQFRNNLNLMLNEKTKRFCLGPLGEFWAIEFLIKEKNKIIVNGNISDTQIPQSNLTFHNVVSLECLTEVIRQVENILNNFNKGNCGLP